MIEEQASNSRSASHLPRPPRAPRIILRCDGCGAPLGPHATVEDAEAAARDAGWSVAMDDGARRHYHGACARQDPLPRWHHYDGDPSVIGALAPAEDLAGETPEGDAALAEGETAEGEGSDDGHDLVLETPGEGAAAAAPAAKRRKHRKHR